VQSNYEKGSEYAPQVINDLKNRRENFGDLSNKAETFKVEMSKAFIHFKKAFIQS
jgi:hypothetical protein